MTLHADLQSFYPAHGSSYHPKMTSTFPVSNHHVYRHVNNELNTTGMHSTFWLVMHHFLE